MALIHPPANAATVDAPYRVEDNAPLPVSVRGVLQPQSLDPIFQIDHDYPQPPSIASSSQVLPTGCSQRTPLANGSHSRCTVQILIRGRAAGASASPTITTRLVDEHQLGWVILLDVSQIFSPHLLIPFPHQDFRLLANKVPPLVSDLEIVPSDVYTLRFITRPFWRSRR